MKIRKVRHNGTSGEIEKMEKSKARYTHTRTHTHTHTHTHSCYVEAARTARLAPPSVTRRDTFNSADRVASAIANFVAFCRQSQDASIKHGQ